MFELIKLTKDLINCDNFLSNCKPFAYLPLRPFIFDLLFNEHLQSIARVGGRNKNKNKMWKLTFLVIKL